MLIARCPNKYRWTEQASDIVVSTQLNNMSKSCTISRKVHKDKGMYNNSTFNWQSRVYVQGLNIILLVLGHQQAQCWPQRTPCLTRLTSFTDFWITFSHQRESTKMADEIWKVVVLYMGCGLLNQISTVPLFLRCFTIVKILLMQQISRSYLTDFTAIQLRWHPPNIKLIPIISLVLSQDRITGKINHPWIYWTHVSLI